MYFLYINKSKWFDPKQPYGNAFRYNGPNLMLGIILLTVINMTLVITNNKEKLCMVIKKSILLFLYSKLKSTAIFQCFLDVSTYEQMQFNCILRNSRFFLGGGIYNHDCKYQDQKSFRNVRWKEGNDCVSIMFLLHMALCEHFKCFSATLNNWTNNVCLGVICWG